ncbi:MAG: hypothetical protein J6Q68_03565 [Clostridia bacterium]|nr:hypothetical protein [Clostridia bacterium]
MNTKKITSSEIEPLKIAALPTRPTAPTAFGGKGYTPTEMKAAFDKLPLKIIESFNTLVDDVESGALGEFLITLEPFKTMQSDIAIIKARLEIEEVN